jgi:D-arginine dehydrogenase
MTNCCDVAVIGAGVIGASAACHLSGKLKTVLIEQESRPGYHSSGRSAAVLLPPYGGPIARALTAASIQFLSNPPSGFSQLPLTAPRGALFLASAIQLPLLDHWQGPELARMGAGARTLSAVEAAEYVPILVTDQIAAAVLLPDVRDIDAAALLHGYLKTFRANGGTVLLNSKVVAISRGKAVWVIETPSGTVCAKTLVNAAGAWADQIAELAGVASKGLVPTRRTMVVVDAPAGIDVRHWPLVADAGETFYFKPDAGRLVVSPADRSPVVAQDIQPEEWDIAVAVERLERATSLCVLRVEHRWAGLRTIAPDEEPIIGFDPYVPDFLWAAGFGGFGVQASFAAGLCCEALICSQSLPAELAEFGVDVARLSPQRLAIARGTPSK